MINRFLLAFLVFLFVPSDSYAGQGDKIYELPSSYIAKHIDATAGTRRVVMIYASWCPYCRQKMPAMMDLERAKPGSVIAISVDESGSDFARYVKKMRDPPFELILSKDSEYKLANTLGRFGILPWEGIPYFILLDENNIPVSQGNFDPDYIDGFLGGK
ncbi:MAG: TlpA family protein disulfide reductase [Alphaproteobacteria bacterium]